jgi:hypothetical protein
MFSQHGKGIHFLIDITVDRRKMRQKGENLHDKRHFSVAGNSLLLRDLHFSYSSLFPSTSFYHSDFNTIFLCETDFFREE